MASKYGKKAHDKVERALHEEKRGKLKSGSGRKVTSRKQAIAIGLSEARREGGKVPPAKKASSKKSPSAKSSAKKSSPAKKSSSSKKSSSAKKSSSSKKSSSAKKSSKKK
jgi:hypothetical protein